MKHGFHCCPFSLAEAPRKGSLLSLSLRHIYLWTPVQNEQAQICLAVDHLHTSTSTKDCSLDIKTRLSQPKRGSCLECLWPQKSGVAPPMIYLSYGRSTSYSIPTGFDSTHAQFMLCKKEIPLRPRTESPESRDV